MRMRPAKRTFATLATGLLVVGAMVGGAKAGGGPSRNYYQSYSYYGRSSADLVVRPDVIVVNFTLRKLTDDPEAGLSAIQSFVDELKRRYQAASESAEISTHNLTVQAAPEKQNPNLQSVVVSGAIELPLLADWDYWKRAHLLVSLVQVAKAVATQQKDPKKTIQAQIAEPTALLKNPEAFRSELTKLWLEQARGFAKAVQSQSAPLEILQCEPPHKVSQQHISLEEVGLSLPFSCRLDIAKIR
jgi:hypothetical protein